MQTGRLQATSVGHVAAQLREAKHGNPMVGAVCAYLYDYVGDLDNIRRMASFYIDRSQPIPYDIALMGELPLHKDGHGGYLTAVPAVAAAKPADATQLPDYATRATKPKEGRISGLCPWLRQGWDYIETPAPTDEHFSRQLPVLNRHLLPGLVTSFDRDGGERLVRHWRMERWQ